MYCRKCGNPITDGESFCNQCGTPVAANNVPVPPGPSAGGTEPAGTEQLSMYAPPYYADGSDTLPGKPKKGGEKMLRTILIVAGSALVVIAAILIPVLIEKAHADQYQAAFALMDSGNWQEAKAEFIALDEYRESADMAEECQDTLDYNAAMALKDKGDFEQARDAFDALGSFKDADDQAAECQKTFDYNTAVALMDAGSNEDALDAFITLDSFLDSADLAVECQNRIDYDAAVALMDTGSYAAARSAFKALGYYSDASDLALQCQDNIDYIAADEAFNDGRFYTAYVVFSSLGGFKDAAARSKACLQEPPSSGELYRNPDLAKNQSFTISNKGKSLGLCVKIFREDTNTLASMVYIAPGKKVKIKLQRGDYTIFIACGSQWFGEKEYFGENAYYDWGIDGIFTISGGYYYTFPVPTPEPDELYRGSMTYDTF